MKTILGTMTFADQVDEALAGDMVQRFTAAGHREVDTAFVYQNGGTEQLLGALNSAGLLADTQMASKANPKPSGLGAAAITEQLHTSLQRIGTPHLDLYYLHSPDLDTDIRETLQTLHQHHQAGHFERLGLSNYAAWQVAEIVELCRRNNWLQPSVYQGMYNALTRDVERELLPCLAHYKLAFYAYNPLAGGLLTGKHSQIDMAPSDGRFQRFDSYPERYWKADYFTATASLRRACQAHSIQPAAAAIRWLRHHSALAGHSEHGIILGASSVRHLQDNLDACNAAPLPDKIIAVLDNGWETVRANCIKYFRP